MVDSTKGNNFKSVAVVIEDGRDNMLENFNAIVEEHIRTAGEREIKCMVA